MTGSIEVVSRELGLLVILEDLIAHVALTAISIVGDGVGIDAPLGVHRDVGCDVVVRLIPTSERVALTSRLFRSGRIVAIINGLRAQGAASPVRKNDVEALLLPLGIEHHFGTFGVVARLITDCLLA